MFANNVSGKINFNESGGYVHERNKFDGPLIDLSSKTPYKIASVQVAYPNTLIGVSVEVFLPALHYNPLIYSYDIC